MNGELAQIASLVAHAKVALESRGAFALPDLAHSTFRFVHSLAFERETRSLLWRRRTEEIGTSVADWFRHLTGAGVTAIGLAVWSSHRELPDHVTAGFSGGGSWGIRTAGARGPSLWLARWTPDRREAPDRRIWSVTYRELPGRDPPVPALTVAAAAAKLDVLLGRAERLAGAADLSPWTGFFGSAREKLHADRPGFEYHPDLLPASAYAVDARRLLAAAERAWVFGGMGSWNDVGFADRALDREYRTLTPELYSAVLLAVAASVNSFPSEGGPPNPTS
jgi:hypothetical protein